MKSSLLWRCRRGLREMDLLLQGFVQTRYDALTDQEKSVFAELLEQPDLDIMDWIMERASPPGPYATLINMIRVSGKTRHDAE